MKRLFFFGELPPNIVHGISLSNQLNIEILKNYYSVSIFEDLINVNKKGIFLKLKSSIFEFIKLIQLVRGKNFDLFYASLPTSVFGLARLFFVYLIVSKNKKITTFLHIHRGDFIEVYNNNFLFKLFVNYFNKKNTKFILLSDGHKKTVSDVLNNTEVLENSINITSKNENKFNDKKIELLYLSNYTNGKGILTLLNAFSELDGLVDVLTLNCYGGFLDENIKAEILKYDKYINININGPISGKEKEDVISNCDFMILPSINEGQPLTIIEALAFGKPIICTNVGFISEMFDSDYKYIYDELNVIQIKEVLNDILKINSDEYHDCSTKLKNRYISHFGKNIHREKLKNIFKVDD